MGRASCRGWLGEWVPICFSSIGLSIVFILNQIEVLHSILRILDQQSKIVLLLFAQG